MKTTIKSIGLFVAFLALHFSAHARAVVPIVDYVDIPAATGSGVPATAEQVRDAILAAAASNKWQANQSGAPNVLSASLLHGKHTVLVSIPYSAQKFSIKYQDSINMKYELAAPLANAYTDAGNNSLKPQPAAGRTPMIHPHYNRWVQDLLQSVKLELKKI